MQGELAPYLTSLTVSDYPHIKAIHEGVAP
jgi:hypothetical protein